ncbi:hypothetical protein EOA29_20810 [Mesorhizobium sp. M1E.F.Ca.ET.063.01.1.1]|nr:hypothetical protein EOA29_20810 [Mesorhizobium sp. M1E.F.Ca.ET.063.01.1.1]
MPSWRGRRIGRSNGTTSRPARQNGLVESFSGRLHDECLNERLFTSYRHARTASKNGGSIAM